MITCICNQLNIKLYADKVDNQFLGDCPFCGKAKHFYINDTTGQWDCKVCGKAGNITTLLRDIVPIYTLNLKRNKSQSERIVSNRGIPLNTLLKFNVGWTGKQYVLPVYNETNNICGLRTWVPGKKLITVKGGKGGLLNLHALQDIKRKNEPVYICEGEWDCMILDWVLNEAKEPGIAVSIPGVNSFKVAWAPLFKDRQIVACLDNDNAGINGQKALAKRLDTMPKELLFLHWSEGLPVGFDIRDYILSKRWTKPSDILNGIWDMTTEKYSEVTVNTETTTDIEDITPDELRSIYHKWLRIDDNDIIDVIYGSILANRMQGEPIWLFLVAPPGGSKSELLMTLVKSECIVSTTSLTPQALISGANWVKEKDPSLIPKLDNKILVIKDFTTILSMHPTARDEIFGILRDAYDGRCEKIFGNGVTRQFESKFGIIAGTTPVIDKFSNMNQSLGERFLKYRMYVNNTDEVLRIQRALSLVNNESTMRTELQDVARRYLNNVWELPIPEIDNDIVTQLIALSQLTARLRGVVEMDRYTQELLYLPSTEVGTRLSKQLLKLMLGIAWFRSKPKITNAEYNVAVKVAMDTAPDRILLLIQNLYKAKALTAGELSDVSSLPRGTTYRILDHLVLLHLVDKTDKYFDLTPSLRQLIDTSKSFENFS